MGATATVKITDNNIKLDAIKQQIEQALSSQLNVRTTVTIQKLQTSGNYNKTPDKFK